MLCDMIEGISMKKIQVLDCTLRDGGYINDWNFTAVESNNIISLLDEANIDIIEIGFLDNSVSDSFSGTKFKNMKKIEEYCDIKKINNSKLVTIIMLGKFSIQEIKPAKYSPIKGIRICFKHNEIDEGIEFAMQVKALGYDVYIQPASITDYSEDDVKYMLKKACAINPVAVYIVDTYGLMTKSEVLSYYKIFNNVLPSNISIGFHSHNNLQLSFSNSQELVFANDERNLIIDSSVFGMGRGAGNLCTELITRYLNDNFQKQYNLLPILEVVDKYINPLFRKYTWGYSVPYYIAAINKCHPNYATYLTEKQSIGVNDINTILQIIPENKKRNYDENLISNIYLDYIYNDCNEGTTIKKLKECIENNIVLLVAPGSSIKNNINKIKTFISTQKIITISINFIPNNIKCDYYLFTNEKRFYQSDINRYTSFDNFIITSNIKLNSISGALRVNFNNYINKKYVYGDISGIIAMRMLKNINVKKIYLAGFDGFKNTDNFISDKYDYSSDIEDIKKKNKLIKEQIKGLKRDLDINFLTESLYED